MRSAFASEPIKIGFLAVMSGNFAQIGQDMVRGAELQIKQRGDINGRKIELLVEDTEAKPAVALRKADRLVSEEKVSALLGVFSSGEMVALAGNASQLGVPILTTNTGSARITGELCNRFVFRSNANDDQVIKAAIEWLKKDEKARKGRWYILGHDYEWGRGASASFKKAIAEGMGVEVVAEDYAPLSTRDWSTYIDKIRASKADYVWAPVTVSVVTDFAKQAYAFGLMDKLNIVAVAGITDAQLAVAGEAAKGLYVASWALWTLNNPGMAEFQKAYFAAYNSAPGVNALTAYGGTGLFLDGLSKAKSASADDLIAGLEKSSYKSPYGDLTMREQDHQALGPAFIGRVRAADENVFGAKWAAYPVEVANPDVTTVPLAATGCKRSS
jgi:branched-chain amino acid transport system substrate-binding protein